MMIDNEPGGEGGKGGVVSIGGTTMDSTLLIF